MQLVVLGLNHRSAAVEVRERFDSMSTKKFQNASFCRRAIVRKFMPY